MSSLCENGCVLKGVLEEKTVGFYMSLDCSCRVKIGVTVEKGIFDWVQVYLYKKSSSSLDITNQVFSRKLVA